MHVTIRTDEHEEWINDHIDMRFIAYASDPNQRTLDELYVLIGTLKIVGFEKSHEKMKKQLMNVRSLERRDSSSYSTQSPPKEATKPKAEKKPKPQRVADPAAFLRERIVGQDAAIERVTQRLAIAHAGLKLRPERPNGVFLFAGPTGVGKTEFARRLAEAEYGDPDAVVRVDMSEYQSRVAASKLVGPDPGYVGYEDSDGWLVTRVRKKPNSVVLLDEIEKAHPMVWNTFLQVFDAGRLTDSHGAMTDFSKTVIVMTSNLGGREGTRTVPGFGSSTDDASVRQFAAIKEVMAPELINRIDDIVFFEPLSLDTLEEIAATELASLTERLAENDWSIQVGAGVPRWIAETGFDPAYGARHLHRNLERTLLVRLAASDARTVRVEVGEDGLVVVAA